MQLLGDLCLLQLLFVRQLAPSETQCSIDKHSPNKKGPIMVVILYWKPVSKQLFKLKTQDFIGKRSSVARLIHCAFPELVDQSNLVMQGVAPCECLHFGKKFTGCSGDFSGTFRKCHVLSEAFRAASFPTIDRCLRCMLFHSDMKIFYIFRKLLMFGKKTRRERAIVRNDAAQKASEQIWHFRSSGEIGWPAVGFKVQRF